MFDAVQQKLTDQWTARTSIRTAGDHLLTGLLFDDAGHRMAPTHATKAGIRYRCYVSLPCLHRETKTAKVGSVMRFPATDIGDVVLKSLNAHLRNQSGMPASAITAHSAIAEVIDRIDVYQDRLAIRLRSRESQSTTKLADDIEELTSSVHSLAEAAIQEIPTNPVAPWLLAKGGPTGAARTTPPSGQRHRTRQTLVGRIVLGSVTDAEQIALRERCRSVMST
jgi:site-specific DNA recombinase